MAENRQDRESELREITARPDSWTPPDLLPEPKPQEGYVFRWVRASTLGQADPTNVSRRMREGWEPVRAEDHPELRLISDPNSQFKGSVEVGGLILCKAPREFALQAQRYYENAAKQNEEAIDSNFLREADPRMPLLKPQKKTEVVFGKAARASESET